MTVFISLSRKRISISLIKRTIAILCTSLMLLASVSCKSTKPRIATTKKEAAKRYPNRTHTPPRTTTHKEKDDRSTTGTSSTSTTTDAPVVLASSSIETTIETALSYKGTRYKYGGSSRSGMDCSGLIYISFKDAGISVPRTSASLLDATKAIDFKQVQKGDLLFFATGKNKSRVSHVGLVVNTTAAEVSFVHASTSRGVIVSTMNEAYWLSAYLSAGRLE